MGHYAGEMDGSMPRDYGLESRIAKLEAALRHAQEALFWHHGENFELDGRRAGDVIKSALKQL